MVRSKLRNNDNKNRNYENWCKYKRQCNLCLNLLRKTNEKQVSDSKAFCKNIKPFFSDKGVNSSKITLVEKKKAIVLDDEKIANKMNNYFINITKNLNLKPLNKNKFYISRNF